MTIERLDVVVPVWNPPYLALFRDLCLPTLLAPGNLPAMVRRQIDVQLVIYTTERDQAVLLGDASYRKPLGEIARSGVAIQVRGVEISDHRASYVVATTAFRDAFVKAEQRGAAAMPLYPDGIWSDGLFASLVDRARAGARIVLALGPRLATERALPLIEPFRRDGALVLPPRRMVQFALDAPHPLFRSHGWGAAETYVGMTTFTWPAGAAGLVARTFHLHPVLITRPRAIGDFLTIDDEALAELIDRPRPIEVLTDSDDGMITSLTPGDTRHDEIRAAAHTPSAVAAHWSRGIQPVHRGNLGHELLLHTDGLADPAWGPARAAAEEVIREIEAALLRAGRG